MIRRALWAAYTALLFYGLELAPVKVVSYAASMMDPLVPFPDPGMTFRHALLFLPEGLLSCLALGLWDGLAFSVAFGAFTELLQYFIPWRVYDVHDLTANVLGSLAGFAIAWLLCNRFSSNFCPRENVREGLWRKRSS